MNDVFYSLAGEGVRAGCPSVFLRLARCNLRCDGRVIDQAYQPVCDTEFESYQPMTADEVVAAVHEAGDSCDWVVLTGGEPGLQLDAALVGRLRSEGYRLAIETNGTVDLSDLGLDWVCVSPKVAEHAIRQRTAHEVKYVRGYGQGVPRTVVQADHYLISPAFHGGMLDRRNLEWCIRLCKDNPPWRLSVQIHPLLGIP